MYNKLIIEKYIYEKLLKSILFDVDHDKFNYEENRWIFETRKLEDIKAIIERISDCFNAELKNSIYDYLAEARNIKSKDYEHRVKLINEMIIELNTSYDTSQLFYRNELSKRRNSKKFLYFYSNDIINKLIPLVNESIVFDSIVLASHSDNISNRAFNCQWLPGLTKSLFYYESINAILEECPELFKNQTFYNRFVSVLNENNKLSNNGSYMFNKKLVKQVNKKIRKV